MSRKLLPPRARPKEPLPHPRRLLPAKRGRPTLSMTIPPEQRLVQTPSRKIRPRKILAKPLRTRKNLHPSGRVLHPSTAPRPIEYRAYDLPIASR
jgi:hypothetical protein